MRSYRWVVVRHVIRALIVLLLTSTAMRAANSLLAATQSRMSDWTFESKKASGNPFNGVDVDVIFRKDGASWRCSGGKAGGWESIWCTDSIRKRDWRFGSGCDAGVGWVCIGANDENRADRI
jgi:hypothetical protein